MEPTPEPAAAPQQQAVPPAEADAGAASSCADGAAAAAASAAAAAVAAPAPDAARLPAAACPLASVLGFDLSRRHSLVALDATTVALPAGAGALLLSLPGLERRLLPGRDGGGVGALAAHVGAGVFAVAEKCRERPPNIHVYAWPSLELLATLPGGTERAYSAATFDGDGQLLAAVGSGPDYMLTLWDWRAGAVVLRSKAFSQEVYGLRFSPVVPGRLVTCGTGHIRFWRMASTFTGLKLQGDLGKFGSVELSDVAAFAELPDGKVLSGCEGGHLLLWDAGAIKALITRPGGAPCHASPVEALHFDEASGLVISGGGDGTLRLWEAAALDVEPPEAGAGGEGGGSSGGGGGVSVIALEVAPVAEVVLPPGTRVRGLLPLDRRSCLVADESGGLLRLGVPANLTDGGGYSIACLLDCHGAGGIAGLAALPDCSVVVTAGADGSVRAHDYAGGRQLQVRAFGAPATALALLPPAAPCCRVAVGFGDGSLRRLARAADGWALLQVARPHTAAVTALALSDDGGRAASVAADGSVFFYSVGDGGEWQPLGYVRLPLAGAGAGPAAAAWAADGATLLVGCGGGAIVEVTAPPGDVDNARSYELRLPVRSAVIKPLHRQLGDGAGGASPVLRLVLAGEGAPAGVVLEEAPLAVTWLACPREAPGSFQVCLAGAGAGAVWTASFDGPQVTAVAAGVSGCATTTALAFSRSGRYRAAGSADGLLRLEPAGSGGVQPVGGSPYWQAPLHDMQSGVVTGLAIAADDSALISAAADGSLLVIDNGLPGAPPRSLAGDAQLPAMADLPAQLVADLPPGAPSYEEGKQAAAADARAAAAATARASLAAEFAALRSELGALVAANGARPPGQRLPREAFSIDPGLAALAERERAAKLDDARAQVAWDAEAAATLLARLRAFFAAQLAPSNMVLRPLGAGSCGEVASVSAPELPPEVQAEIDAAAAEAAAAEGCSPGSPGRRRTGPGFGLDKRVSVRHPQGASGGGDAGGDLPSVASKAALRRAARREREAAWAAHNAARPDAGFEAPEDVATLAQAAATIGDLKLRGDPGFIPDEDQRMTLQRKRAQMAALAARASEALAAFNGGLAELGARKRGAQQRLSALSARLQAVHQQLARAGELVPPSALVPDQSPEERRTAATPPQLAEHAARKAAEAARKAGSGGAASGFGGFAPAGGGGQPGNGADAPGAGNSSQSGGHGAAAAVSARATAAAMQPVAGSAARRLEVEAAALGAEAQSLIAGFDAALVALAARRQALVCDLAGVAARQLVHYQELLLLKAFEVREAVLLAKLGAKGEERDGLAGRVSELETALEERRAEADSIGAARASVVAAFEAFVEDKGPHAEALTHIFNRKIKRSSKRGGAAGGGDGGSEDDDSDLDGSSDGSGDGDDDEEWDEAGGGPEVCPPGCEQAVYDRVCELREARLDEEDAAAEVARAAEGLRKEREVAAKKVRLVEQSLAAINTDMLEFQREKQAALNQVEVEVALRASQVQVLTDGRLPPGEELARALVVTAASLERLGARIQGLEDEKADLRGSQRELRRRHATLLEEQARARAVLAEQQARCRDVQLLKFGQEIDMALLDTIGVRNNAADELRAALKQQERTQARELAAVEAEAAARVRELLAHTRDNTDALNAVSGLTRSQRGLEAEVLSHKSGLFEDQLAARRAALGERHALVTVVNERAAALTALRSKLATLRRKDSVLYA